MRVLKKARIPGYFALALLLTLVLTLPACKKEQPSSAKGEAQNGLVRPDAPSQAWAKTADGKIPLKMLYVGLPDTERQQDFVSFLTKNFAEVKAVDLYAFKEEQTTDSDVAILDKDGIQWSSRGGRPLRDLQVSAQYSRPTISLGIPGAFWSDRMRLKTGYM